MHKIIFLTVCVVWMTVNASGFQKCDLRESVYELTSPPSSISPKPDRYELPQVKQHIDKKSLSIFADNKAESLSCIDARDTDAVFGTPGGDFGELILALQSYSTVKNIKLEKDKIMEIMKQYIEEIASEFRPFYYHTSQEKLAALFKNVTPNVIILPTTFPYNATEWYEKLIKPDHQGCGHVNLLLTMPTQMGISDLNIVHYSLQSLFELFWTPDILVNKIKIDVLQGSLDPDAVISVSNTGCDHENPLLTPNKFGSSVFIHHESAATDFRDTSITKFFKKYDKSVNKAQLLTEMNKLGKTQMNCLLKNLPSAAAVNAFSVKLKSSVSFNIATSEVDFFVKWSLLGITAFFGLICWVIFTAIFCFFVGSTYQASKNIKFKVADDHIKGKESFFEKVTDDLFETPKINTEVKVIEVELNDKLE